MNKNVIFILFTFIIFTSYGQQNRLQGIIKDAKTNEALTGASIFVPELKNGTVSDIEGKFQIKNIPFQEIHLQISMIGYQNKNLVIHFDKKDKTTVILLKETPFEIGEVIVSTGFNKLQKDNVMKVEHRSLKSMQRKGITNLMQGVSQIPGVTAMSTGTGINKPVIRGLTGNRVLVYNQNSRLENYQFGEKHGLGIEASGIDGVEIIKGPASLLYGSDAMGGVMYLIPEKYAPAHQTGFSLLQQYYTNTQGIHTSAGVKTSTANWRFLSRIAYKKEGDYQTATGERAYNSRNNMKDLKIGTAYHNKKFTSDLRYNYNRSLNGITHSLSNNKIDYQPVDKYQDISQHNISWKNNFTPEKYQIKTNLAFTSVDRNLIKQNQTLIGMRLNTFNTDIKWYLTGHQNFDLIAGNQSMYQTNRNHGKNYLLPDAEIFNTGSFVNVNYKFSKYTIQSGLRYDYRHISTKKINENRPGIDKKLHSLSGALGTKFELISNMNLRINFAAGFRAPNLAELTSYGEHENRLEIGNPELQNENNYQMDINWDYSASHFEFFINGFYNKINNYIYLEPQNQFAIMIPVYRYRQDNAVLSGGEAGFHFHPHPLDWLHISSSFETVTGKKHNGEYLPLIPADQWKNEIRLTRKFSKRSLQNYFFRIEINRTFKSRPGTGESAYPPYTLINTGIGADWKWKKWKVNALISTHNLLNVNYISNLSVLRENNIPNQGRNIILQIRLSPFF
jgi:iron complex outermembrane receptor protein